MADLTGNTLGKYQVIARLGRGGMAEVYRAYQPGMDRYVAVKVMHGHMVEEEGFVERFRKEAQIVGALRHPNIVQVIDFDMQESVYYMVMEYIQGQTLSAMLKLHGALPIRESLTIARKLADAVAYAHQEGMLHRDIKPANVLFTKAGEPVLTDFGIARIMGSTHMTQSGIVLGTPAYMSPEAGRGERVDERSDIYSLGIVLYEMLTGRVPFDADTPYAVIYKHISDPLVSPSTLNPEIGDAVERVVLKSLAKNLEDRYQSAADMRNALDVALSQAPAEAPVAESYLTAPMTSAQAAVATPSGARPVSPPVPLATEEVRRRSPVPLIVGLVALLAIVGIGILALISSQQGQATLTVTSVAALGTSTVATAAVLPPITDTPAATPFTTETANALRTETASALVAVVVETATDMPTASETPAATSTPTEDPTATPTPNPPTPIPPTDAPTVVALAPPTTEALIREVREDIDNGLIENALTRVAPYRERYPDDADVKLLEAFALLQFLQEPDKLEAGRLIVEDVLSDDPANGAAHFILGLYDRDTGDGNLDEALRRFNLAIENGFMAADVYRARANINRDRDVPKEEVLEDYRRALELEPDNDMVLIDRGVMLLYYMIDPFAALQDFEASYALVPATWKHELLGVAYLRLDRADEAFALYEQSVQGEMANEAYYLADGSYVALSAGHVELAREWAERALALDPQSNDARQVLGLVAAEEGDYLGALAHLDRVEAGSDGLPYLNWQFSHELKEDRARMLALLGDTDEAIALYQQVVDEFGAWWSSPYLALGQLMLDQGDVEAARGYFTQALETATNMRDDGDVAAAEDAFVDLQIVEAILEAESLLDQGDAEGALEVLDGVIDRFDPEWTDVYLLRGWALGELGDFGAAQDSLNRAREIAESAGETDMLPDIEEAQRELNALQPPSGEGTVAQRISELETYIEGSETEDVQYYIELGMLYRDTGDTTAARQTLMRGLAVTNNTGDEDGRAAVLDALRNLDSLPAEPPPTDDPEQRIVDLEQYIQDAQPTDIRWYVELATLYRDQGDAAEARRTLMRALAMLTTEGGDPDARNAILGALRELTSTSDMPPPPTRGDDLSVYAEALDTYIKSHQLDNIDLYLELAGVYQELDDMTQARRTLMRALAVITTTGAEDQRPRLLDALQSLDEQSQAEPPSLSQRIEDLSTHIVETSSTNLDDYLELANLYVESERTPLARHTLFRALHMLYASQGSPEAHQRAREALQRIEVPPFERRDENPGLAAMQLVQFIEYWQPTDVNPYLELAALYRETGDPEQARWTLIRTQDMLTLTGGSAEARHDVLHALSSLEVRGAPAPTDDLATRIVDLEAYIVENDPDDTDLYLELAALYRYHEDNAAARRTLMRALAMLSATGSDGPRPRIMETLRSLELPLSLAAPSLGDPADRIEELEQLIEAEQPQDVRPYLELATLYRERGDSTNARRTLMRALAMLTATDGGPDERNAVLEALGELR